jgi:hypothetical protein
MTCSTAGRVWGWDSGARGRWRAEYLPVNACSTRRRMAEKTGRGAPVIPSMNSGCWPESGWVRARNVGPRRGSSNHVWPQSVRACRRALSRRAVIVGGVRTRIGSSGVAALTASTAISCRRLIAVRSSDHSGMKRVHKRGGCVVTSIFSPTFQSTNEFPINMIHNSYAKVSHARSTSRLIITIAQVLKPLKSSPSVTHKPAKFNRACSLFG